VVVVHLGGGGGGVVVGGWHQEWQCGMQCGWQCFGGGVGCQVSEFEAKTPPPVFLGDSPPLLLSESR